MEDWRIYRDKHFWEEYARQLLIEFVDQNEFNSLMVRDCPDLQNEKWGIEVRLCWSKEDGMRDHLISKYFKCQASEISPKDILKMNRLGMPYSVSTLGIVSCMHYGMKQLDTKEIEGYILEKMEKINTDSYQNCLFYGLFLFSPFFSYEKENIIAACKNLWLRQLDHKRKVSDIFFQCFPNMLYRYSINKNTITHQKLPTDKDGIMGQIIDTATAYCKSKSTKLQQAKLK